LFFPDFDKLDGFGTIPSRVMFREKEPTIRAEIIAPKRTERQIEYADSTASADWQGRSVAGVRIDLRGETC
jgi:hypothetical protein